MNEVYDLLRDLENKYTHNILSAKERKEIRVLIASIRILINSKYGN